MPGTNAVYSFKNAGGSGRHVHVYDNSDAYPTGAAKKLIEACEIGGMRTEGMARAFTIGDIPDSLEMRVVANNWRQTCATNYRYEIEYRPGNIFVTGYCPDHSDLPDDFRLAPGENFPKWRKIFHGTLEHFQLWARQEELTVLEESRAQAEIDARLECADISAKSPIRNNLCVAVGTEEGYRVRNYSTNEARLKFKIEPHNFALDKDDQPVGRWQRDHGGSFSDIVEIQETMFGSEREATSAIRSLFVQMDKPGDVLK